MLQLPSEIREHLERGGTILVPTRQRAAALRLAYSVAMLNAGRKVWSSPDVLPWSAWVERSLTEARARGEPVPRRLSATGDWLLWREAMREAAAAAAAGHEILAPEGLIDSVRRALGLLEDHVLELPTASSPEAALLLRAREHYRRRCRELNVLDSSSWRESAAYLRPGSHMVLVGFAVIGSARRRWLEQYGATFTAVAASEWAAREVQVTSAPSSALEAEAAAEWCAAALIRDPNARLLIVVPRLHEQRHLWQRALSQRLDGRLILGAGAVPDANAELGTSNASAYAIEGGQPLRIYPVVASALNLIALAAGQAQFDQLSALLRSPYLSALDRTACLALDVWLREQNIDASTIGVLEGLIEPIAAAVGAAAAVRALSDAVHCIAPDNDSHAMRAPRESWARVFAASLARCGWPGPGLNSDEQQVRVRFDELLGDFGFTDPDAKPLSLSEASALLQELSSRIAFEPASDDVAVSVTDSLDDPIVRYDGIWVAGLSADVWPAPSRPDPLIPLPLQRSAGMPSSSAAGQLQRALESQQHWLRAGVRCVLSWAASDLDLPVDMSPLLQTLAAAHTVPQVMTAETQICEVVSLEHWLAQLAPPLSAWSDSSGPAWPMARALRGGTRLLELQSLCPFRSFAELRLGARPLPSPSPGIDPRQRGRILHRALELFWLATQDLDTLRRRSAEATLVLVRQCTARALEELAAMPLQPLQSLLLARERERTHDLMLQLIEWERTREHFVTHALEWPRSQAIAGTVLQLRLDRVDRLDDGRLVVIDYKSGKAEAFEADAARPMRPQLPAYAMAAGNQVAAVLSVYLGREAVKLRGVADRRDCIGNLRGAVEEAAWPLLLRRWHERLQALVQEFLDGHASVDPQAGVCDRCHLQMVCRVDPALLAAAARSAGTADDDDGGAEGIDVGGHGRAHDEQG